MPAGKDHETAFLNLLIVDDDEADRIALRRAVGKFSESAKITELVSGKDAIATILGGDFDCVFLDYKLPDADGLEILRDVREHDDVTPVVAFTGRGNELVAVDWMKAGATDYMSKAMLTPDGVGMALRYAMKVRDARLAAHKSETALARNESFLRAILDNMQDAIGVADSDGIIRSVNRRCETLMGYREDECLGKRVADLCPGVLDEPAVAFAELQETGGKSFEIEVQKEGGRPMQLEVSLFPIETISETLIGLNLRDVSARQELAALQDTFVSIVSHELRTPVTSIYGSIKLLLAGLSGNIDGEATNLLEICRRNCQRLILLLNDILDMQKIQAGKMEIAPMSVDVGEFLRECVDGNDGIASGEGIELVASVAGGPLTMFADPVRMQQVVANLVSNAIKFSPSGSTVTLRATANSGSIRFEIADNGPGILPEHADVVFERFGQVHEHTADKKGTGLGLPISKALVEAHGGAIGFETIDSAGTVFWFTVPERKGGAGDN